MSLLFSCEESQEAMRPFVMDFVERISHASLVHAGHRSGLDRIGESFRYEEALMPYFRSFLSRPGLQGPTIRAFSKIEPKTDAMLHELVTVLTDLVRRQDTPDEIVDVSDEAIEQAVVDVGQIESAYELEYMILHALSVFGPRAESAIPLLLECVRRPTMHEAISTMITLGTAGVEAIGSCLMNPDVRPQALVTLIDCEYELTPILEPLLTLFQAYRSGRCTNEYIVSHHADGLELCYRLLGRIGSAAGAASRGLIGLLREQLTLDPYEIDENELFWLTETIGLVIRDEALVEEVTSLFHMVFELDMYSCDAEHFRRCLMRMSAESPWWLIGE